jgi:hypothetical protein
MLPLPKKSFTQSIVVVIVWRWPGRFTLSCFVEWAADPKVDLTLVSINNNGKHLGDYELELVDNDWDHSTNYLELLIVLHFIRPWRKPMRLCLDLRVGQEEVLGFLVPWQTNVLVLLVHLCLLILVILLSNQKANILGWVGHGRFLLVLKILCCHLLSIITTACGEGQTLLLVNVKHSTNLHHLMTEVGVNDDDGRADWLCHVSRNGQQIVRSISP